MALSLPPELWLLVFLHLDSLSLAACACLSSSFLPLAHARLFAHVSLLPRRRPPATALASVFPDACTKLLHLLSTSPSLAHHIKRLSIIDGTLFPSLARRDQLNGAPWFLKTSPHVLHTLFQKLNLHSLDLVFPDGPKVSWNLIPQDIRCSLLASSPHLHSLSLHNLSFDTPSTLISTLSHSSITHLTLHNIKLYPDLLTDYCPEKNQTWSRHAKSFPHDPPQSLSLTHTLQTLCISSDPLHQDPDTLHLLSSLFAHSSTRTVIRSEFA
ncbi:hypothetical protein Agabi119p4_8206 [Agaricus bisporus var. burnettii]|uniref:F-box domain-containing protein n=1 Tax=Agaricus bisporus var. burnettii TaxID=192524 RepID=A0A8H7C6Q5_AGABI|nr:hypothetical protein Agabi119p4_8206 [Agaricus bisporus var. burnettii]